MTSAKIREQIIKLAKDFERDGYGCIEDFLTDQEIQSLRDESVRLIREESVREREKQVFSNDNNAKSDYFITSGDKIRYFFEKKAFDQETGKLLVPEDQSLAKIAHALHCLNPVFRQVTYSAKMRDIFKTIDFLEPTVMQSMVIFKNPKVGGEYTPHQDASFLYAEPIENSLCGIWLALDDANEQNGCLEFIPGSHRWPLARRFVRTVKDDGHIELEWTAPVQSYDLDKFVKVPVKRGTLVLIHGLVVHRSAANTSDKPRWIYTFHAYDKSKASYDKLNWLQVDTDDSNSPYKLEMDKLAGELAKQYSSYFDVDTSHQEMKLNETIEECLTHLEELCSALDNYEQSSAGIEQSASVISSRNETLDRLHEQLCAVESYVSQVNQLLSHLESSMDTLEGHAGKPVTRKLRQIISLLPRLSTVTNFNSSAAYDDDSDQQLSTSSPKRAEILARVGETGASIGKLTSELAKWLNK